MMTLDTLLTAVAWVLVIATCAFLVYARLTYRSRMAATAEWIERQRSFGEKLLRREIREENERSFRLQVENGGHRLDALEIAKLHYAILTRSDEELDQVAALVLEEVAL